MAGAHSTKNIDTNKRFFDAVMSGEQLVKLKEKQPKGKKQLIQKMRSEKLKDIDLSHRVTSIINPKRLNERRKKLELDEANAKLWTP